MAIPIECESCHSTYKVADALAGKKVKCKSCGESIPVPESDVVPTKECLSCGAVMPLDEITCPACSFNTRTGQKEAKLLDMADELGAPRRKRKWVRSGGNPTLEMLDGLLKLVVLAALVGGIVMAVVHFFNMPGGFSAIAVVPMIVVLVMIAGIIAPLATLAINTTVRTLKLPARDDTYVRVLVALMLPFIAALIAGWPDSHDWGWIVRMTWLVAVLLLVYFFRAEVIEWISSVAAAALAVVVGFVVVHFAAMGLTTVTGPLDADMLPAGPWTALATDHSSTRQPIVAATVPATAGANGGIAGATTGPAMASATGPAGTEPTGANVATPSPTDPPTNGNPAGGNAALRGGTVAVNLTPTPAAGQGLPSVKPPPLMLASDFLSDLNTDERLRGVEEIYAPLAFNDLFMVVRGGESATVERWAVNPLAMKEKATYPLVPKKAPQFALSPKGDLMVALQFFPRTQLEVTPLDGNKALKKSVPMDLPEASAILLGCLDQTRFCVRRDASGSTGIEVFGLPALNNVRQFNLDQINSEANSAVLSPNGKLLAAFAQNQVLLYNTDNGQVVRRIPISNGPSRFFGMAFSPDGSQLAVYAAIEGMPTVESLKTLTGDLGNTTIVSTTPVEKDFVPIAHSLIWLGSGQFWLINGTDFREAATGKKLATLATPPLIDVQAISSNTLAFTLKSTDGTQYITLAKANEAELPQGGEVNFEQR